MGLNSAKAVGPYSPADWPMMKAPGSFWQTQDFPYQAMAWRDATSLYSFEANGRRKLSSRVAALAGLRWLQLNDSLQGTLTPVDRGEPSWKQHDPGSTLSQLQNPPLSTSIVANPPFWTARTRNNLLGAQVGAEASFAETSPFLSAERSRPAFMATTPNNRPWSAWPSNSTRLRPQPGRSPSLEKRNYMRNISLPTGWRSRPGTRRCGLGSRSGARADAGNLHHFALSIVSVDSRQCARAWRERPLGCAFSRRDPWSRLFVLAATKVVAVAARSSGARRDVIWGLPSVVRSPGWLRLAPYSS